MSDITNKDMIEYLKNAVELELSIYRQKKIIEEGEKEIKDHLPDKDSVSFPIKRKVSEPDKPKRIAELERNKKVLIVAGICFVIYLFFLYMQIGQLMPWWLVLAEVLIIAACVYGVVKSEKDCKMEYEKYQQSLKNYENEVQDREKGYKRSLAIYEKRLAQVDEEIKKCNNAYEVIRRLDKTIEQTQHVLEKLYSYNIIYPKYRNMVAICSIYEYFVIGRCTEMMGAGGAYNLYEEELGQNRIIDQLDEIESKIDKIKQNQYVLYTELEKTEKIVEKILIGVKDLILLGNEREIKKYCEQVTAENMEMMKYIESCGEKLGDIS